MKKEQNRIWLFWIRLEDKQMECTTNFNRIRNNLQTLKLNEMDIHLSEYLDKLQSGDIDVTELIYELTKWK